MPCAMPHNWIKSSLVRAGSIAVLVRLGALITAGAVVFIAPDSGMPAGQGTATYLVKIELNGDELGRGDYRGHVKLGMAGQVEIVTGQESLLRLLVKQLRHTISLG
jgi:hypothetical protein